MSNQELINKVATKYAALSTKEFFGRVGQGLAVGLGLVTITRAADLIIEKIKEWRVEAQSKDYFEKMLEAHPQLLKEDPNEVAKYWASLYHFAPHMAQDPLASGAYITQSMKKLSGSEFGGPPPETFNTLVDVQKKFTEGRTGQKETTTDLVRKAYTSAFAQALIQETLAPPPLVPSEFETARDAYDKDELTWKHYEVKNKLKGIQ